MTNGEIPHRFARTVLVTDGDQRAALAVVRSLGRAGHRVYVCSTGGRSIAGASRYCASEASIADPLQAPEMFVGHITEIVERHDVNVVLPIAERSIVALLPARGQLLNVCLPFVDAHTFGRVSDKAQLLRAAKALGIAVPEQRLAGTREEACDIGADSLPYPIVLKPSRSLGVRAGTRVPLTVRYAADRRQLFAELRALDDAAFPLLMQRRVVGPGVGIFLLLWDGELHAVFSHRRIREKPPSGGVSVYAESIAADPRLVERSRALLDHFGWRGVAMVEYKLDATTGTPYLMEVNGRFWGSLQLAIDAGVDFPRRLLEAAGGARGAAGRADNSAYRVGIRTRWWWGDVDHLLTRLRRSRTTAALPPDAPGRGRAVMDFLRLWRAGDRNEVLRANDPLPFLRESVEWLHRR